MRSRNCPTCQGKGTANYTGRLGGLRWYRCENCGHEHSIQSAPRRPRPLPEQGTEERRELFEHCVTRANDLMHEYPSPGVTSIIESIARSYDRCAADYPAPHKTWFENAARDLRRFNWRHFPKDRDYLPNPRKQGQHAVQS